MNRFDNYLESVHDGKMKMALIATVDSMELARVWFETHEVQYTTADLLKVAEITVAAIAALKKEE